MDPAAAYARYEAAFEGRDAPFAFVDLDAMWSNADEMLARAGAKPIRVASKSVRCRAVLDAIARRNIAPCSARQRTDFVATRIGLPPARASISSAFDHIASRSTNANGASRPSKALS